MRGAGGTIRRRAAACAAWVGTVALTIAVWPMPGGAAPTSAVDTELDTALELALEESGARSISAAVLWDDGTSWAGAEGTVDPARGKPARPSLAYPVASVTKMLTAATALRLVDRGVLELDEPVSRWLPDLPRADRITLRQLLAHTSGMTDIENPKEASHRWTPTEVLAATAAPVCEPGACIRYSNDGYVAAGEVLASAAGKPFDDVLREEILDPLHLDDTWLQGFERQQAKVAPALLEGDPFVSDPKAPSPSPEFATRSGASGALAATPSDLVRFGRALFTGRVLSADARSAMTDFDASAALECVDAESCPPAYGLGVGQEVINGWAAYAHPGSTGSLLAYYPHQRITVAITTNGGADPMLIARDLTEAIPEIDNDLELFSVGVDGSKPSRMAHRTRGRADAVVSPDGKEMAYSRAVGIEDDADLAVADVDGSHEEILLDGSRRATDPTWSPDGAELAFSSQDDGVSAIHVVDRESGVSRAITEDEAWIDGPEWSPDGSLIAYSRVSGPSMEIRVVRPDGTGGHTVISLPVRGRYMGYPSWTPDGQRLVFTGADGPDTDLQIVGLDGSGLTTLTHNHIPDSSGVVSDDGTVAYASLGDIHVLRLDDPTSIVRVTHDASDEFGFSWVPGEARLLFNDRIARG